MPDIGVQRITAAQDLPDYLFPLFSCHSQVVEKCDKLMMAASAAICLMDLYARKLKLSMQCPSFLRNVTTSYTVNNLFNNIYPHLLNSYK